MSGTKKEEVKNKTNQNDEHAITDKEKGTNKAKPKSIKAHIGKREIRD